MESVKYDLMSAEETSTARCARHDKFTSPVDNSVCFHMETAYVRHKQS